LTAGSKSTPRIEGLAERGGASGSGSPDSRIPSQSAAPREAALGTIRDLPSPNQQDRPAKLPIDMLILHYTGMQTAQAAVNRLRDPLARVSSHYVVHEDGAVLRLVPEERRAAHAGISYWRGHTALNDRSIGIEIVNPGHAWGYRDFPAVQMAAVRNLCLDILSRHPISSRNVVAHSDVAPDRKEDPGERFDWRGLARHGVGLWPEGVPDRGTDGVVHDATGLRDVRGALAAIGYRVAPEGPLDQALATVLRAFQRHWRPEAITGQADNGTRTRVAAVARLIDGD
jgi:N-acetylmuramoyl-L-alanine amidase